MDTHGHGEASVTVNSIHARPQQHSSFCLVAQQSDTAVVSLQTGVAGIEGTLSIFGQLYILFMQNLDFQVGQVCVIFVLPPASIPILFPPTLCVPSYLVYIEWFTPFPPAPD